MVARLQGDILGRFQGVVIIQAASEKILCHILQDYKVFLQNVEGINSEACLGPKPFNVQQNNIWVTP